MSKYLQMVYFRRRFGNPTFFVNTLRYVRWLGDPDGVTPPILCEDCGGTGQNADGEVCDECSGEGIAYVAMLLQSDLYAELAFKQIDRSPEVQGQASST